MIAFRTACLHFHIPVFLFFLQQTHSEGVGLAPHISVQSLLYHQHTRLSINVQMESHREARGNRYLPGHSIGSQNLISGWRRGLFFSKYTGWHMLSLSLKITSPQVTSVRREHKASPHFFCTIIVTGMKTECCYYELTGFRLSAVKVKITSQVSVGGS